eukprot:m.127027 g.127027  ORF g.127027 m.127027 type:complete len:231 (+) comp17403_c0_seq1:99-791(+)
MEPELTILPEAQVSSLTFEPFAIPGFENKNEYVGTIDSVMSAQECQDLIQYSESRGYAPALLNVGGGKQIAAPEIRNSDRCIIDSPALAESIFLRIEHLLPQEWTQDASTFDIVGLNERLRFLRYDPGQKFLVHKDGHFVRNKDEISFVTVQLYLNEGFSGGRTRFFGKIDGLSDEEANPGCVPVTGKVLTFQHRLYHDGEELKKGRKYAIRTDVMYRRRQETHAQTQTT